MLKAHSKDEVASLTASRPGEVKIGEAVQLLSSLEKLSFCRAQYIVLGINEDIGIRANLGLGGARDAYEYFLKAFLNMQSNSFIDAHNIALAGSLNFEDLLAQSDKLKAEKPKDLEQLRKLTVQIDNEVIQAIETIVASGKRPIIIGGGHNNSYGNIVGCSKALKQKINLLNIDPHADYRALEGRHSGNGFSYAKSEGFLNRYGVWGLFPTYNNQEILDQFHSNPDLTYHSFEKLLTLNTEEKDRAFKNLLHWLGFQNVGLELDMDSITNFPVSALNPSGFSLNEVRSLVRATAALRAPLYFHLCEASPGRANHASNKQTMGKAQALLVWDFISSINNLK